MNRQRTKASIGLSVLSLGWMALSHPALGDSANFEFDGKIYNKFLYANDGTQGCVWLGNPLYSDNITGDNGTCSEFELGIRATISKHVRAGARLQSRWGAVWQDWWENGDLKIVDGSIVSFPGDTSGESLGMNHGQYIKLRGFFIEFTPPLPSVESVLVGASDLAMFNPWTVGKIRYIDRDNARGIFLRGGFGAFPLKYEGALIALPKLWGSANWNAGNGDLALTNPYITQDWAYAFKLESNPVDRLKMTAIASWVNDVEFNLEDADAFGTINPEGFKDGAIDTVPRYQALNATFETDIYPTDIVHLYGLFGYSWSSVNLEYATNNVENAQGFGPIVYSPEPVQGLAGIFRTEMDDPFGIGLSLSMEYFNIGTHWNSILGSRREADVLLTQGFVDGGQLPTLNIANEFQDWDEPWFESAIGWHGLTTLLTQMIGLSELKGEYTYLTYNTNMQNRDVDSVYPSFLYSDGFTDLDFYDYANVSDRGRDLRSVYRRYEARTTQIFGLWFETWLDIGTGLTFKTRARYIHDKDLRILDLEDDNDNYLGRIGSSRFEFGYQLTNEMSAFIGDEISYWEELNRSPLISGNLTNGYYDYITRKNKVFGGLEYNFAGVKLKYLAEWILKDQDRYNLEGSAEDFSSVDEMHYFPTPFSNEGAYKIGNRIRTKASLEAAW